MAIKILNTDDDGIVTRAKIYTKIVQKAWDDAEFKKELTANLVHSLKDR